MLSAGQGPQGPYTIPEPSGGVGPVSWSEGPSGLFLPPPVRLPAVPPVDLLRI